MQTYQSKRDEMYTVEVEGAEDDSFGFASRGRQPQVGG